MLLAVAIVVATAAADLGAWDHGAASTRDVITREQPQRMHRRGATVAAATTTTTTTTAAATTTTTVTVRPSACSNVARCIKNPQCNRCLEALNASSGVHSLARYQALTKAGGSGIFFGVVETLASTHACSTNVTPLALLGPALLDMSQDSCVAEYRINLGTCPATEYRCFSNEECWPCLFAVTEAVRGRSGMTKGDALRLPACNVSELVVKPLLDECTPWFPVCSFLKLWCTKSEGCARCLESFESGDGAAAARNCDVHSIAGKKMDDVVTYCTEGSEAGCSFWKEKCAELPSCAACLEVIGNGESASEIIRDMNTPACQAAFQDRLSRYWLGNINDGCPGISACRRAIAECAISTAPEVCLMCLNGTAPRNISGECAFIEKTIGVAEACKPCSSRVHEINRIVLVTAIVGGVSAPVCIAVILTMLARGRDRVSMRDRIVIGLLMANAVYSTANAVPLNLLRTGVTTCGSLALPFDTIRFGRAWWFGGKYALVAYELFIVSASIRALVEGAPTVPPLAEALTHLGCAAAAGAAFATFFIVFENVRASGYNAATELVAQTNEHAHPRPDDDMDDDAPYVGASQRFGSARDAYDNLVRNMLVAWDCLVVIAFVLWIVLRVVHRRALVELRAKADADARAEAADPWGDTRRSAWEARRRMFQARRDAFAEVAGPLEPYVIVLFLFGVPAGVMSTNWCDNSSGATWLAHGSGDAIIEFGTCNVWCELVLAFRSLGTVVVFLLPWERRAELLDVRTTTWLLWNRVIGCCCRRDRDPLPHALLDDTDELRRPSRMSSDDDDRLIDDSAAWQISEHDIVLDRSIGQGGFGEVWRGRMRPDNKPVAVKILFAGAADDDGDLIDLNANEDFRNECAALQGLDSPHLIRFFGYGTTADGHGFIVTELLSLGSLESVLHDRARELLWWTRASIALQVALGMEHLHSLHMLHRDLKSANVLLDEHLKAKVCDFGLARVARPATSLVVYSPFTGTARHVPAVGGTTIADASGAGSLPTSALSAATTRVVVSVRDASGSMTKAAGTALWMAPEVFRGDQDYTRAVDIYSFGIVLWEIAARATPWAELRRDATGDAEFLLALNSALQTNRRPTVPKEAESEAPAFVAVMRQCWAGDPADRPSFSAVASELASCLRGCSAGAQS